MPEPGRPRVTRAARIQWAVVMLATVGALVAAAVGGSADRAPGEQRSVAPSDRVFLDDMAAQAAEANRLVVQAAGSPLEELARRIEAEDNRIIGRGQRAAERKPAAAADDRAVSDAMHRHVAEDRIIARIALETGTSGSTRRAAAELLRASRDWTVPSRD